LITNVYVDGFNLYYRALKDTPNASSRFRTANLGARNLSLHTV